MPDVKWVSGDELYDDTEILKEWATPIPVLTLDDLEEWLKEGFDGEGDPYLNLRDLLAQVQAMKEGRT